MKWFKFYGSDWLTDMKIMNMSIEDRLCFITLLCLSANDENLGVVKDCDEESIIKLTHLYEDPYDDDNEVSRARGVLKRLVNKKMITIDNIGNVTLLNFDKRQSQNLTGYERVKRYREKQKEISNRAKDKGNDNNDNAMITQVITSDKKRIDKNRIDKSNTLFDLFYSAYPKKVQKSVALKSFNKLNPDKKLLKVILKDIENKKKSEQWKKGGGQFIQYPATYLNQKRWEDDYIEPEPEKKPYFRGDPMKKVFGVWKVICDGEWKTFAESEKKIEYK